MAEKKVGVQFVVEGEEQFSEAMRRAEQRTNTVVKGIQGYSESLMRFGQEVTADWVQFGEVVGKAAKGDQAALEQLRQTEATLREETEKLFQAKTELAKAESQSAQVVQEEVSVRKQAVKVTDEHAQSHSRLSESAIQSSRAFFALTLASFGLMTIEKELKQAFGEDLPPAFEKTIAGIQEIASFGSAGAFIGGAPGAIIGGITGAVIALGSAMLQLDPEVQKLNQSLESMSKKDELVNTLSTILDISKDEAQTLQDAASKNAEFAEKLELITKAAEPQPALLAALKVGWEELGEGFATAGDAAIDVTGAIKEITSDIVYLATLIQSINLTDILGALSGDTMATLRLSREGIDITGALAEAEKKRAATLKGIDDELTATIPNQEEMNNLLNEAQGILEGQNNALDKARTAQERYNQAIEDANQRLSQLNERTQNQLDAAQQQYNNAVANAARARQDAIDNSEQQLTDRIADLWQGLQDKVVDINSNLADRIADINMQLGNRIADIQLQLQNKLEQIDLDLANKREQLQHQYQDNLNKANAAIEDAAKELARKLYEIERQRLESIEQLDFNTALQLETAKTDHDRDRILRQRQFELAQINQRANDARDDAQNTFAQKVADAEKERELAKRNYDYELALAERLAEQKRQEARETAAEQIAIAQRQAQQQIAIAQREAAEALAQAERRYEEEKAQAVRSYNEQVAAAQRAEQNKLEDAKRALKERDAAIKKSAELEREQIESTRKKAVDAYNEIIALVAELLGVTQQFAKELLNLSAIQKQIAGTQGFSPIGGGNFDVPPLVGGANGLELDVPMEARYSNDRYLIGASAGEHVSITPANNTSNNWSRTMNVTIPVYDASDPQRTAQQIKRILNDVAFGMG